MMRKKTDPAKLARGFSLIELMVAVVIIGILTAIAVPSYQSYIQRADRTVAQSALIQLAATMERYYAANNNTYVGMILGDGPDADTDIDWFPTTAPIDDTNPPTHALYTLAITAADANSYTIQATPRAGTAVATDLSFSLNSTGAKKRCQTLCANSNNWADSWDGS